MGRTHFAHLSQHPDVQLVALSDKHPDKRAGRWRSGTGNIGARSGEQVDVSDLHQYADPLELVRDPEVDVVIVTLPTPLHPDVAIAALEAGKHVFSEKPMARTVADCDRMTAAARRSGRTLMIGQCIRFWPQYETIRALIDAGRLGDVRFMTLRRVSSPPLFASDNWYMDHTQSGGALLDLHVHDVDFAQDFWGPPHRLHASGSRGPSGGIDHVAATWHWDDGRYAVLEGGWCFHIPFAFEMAITVYGTTGTAEWSSAHGEDVYLYTGAAEREAFKCDTATGWAREMDYFVAQLRAGQPASRCTPESSRTSIRLAELERESIEGGASEVLVRRVAGA
jgi:predicted dehydrogenase